MRHRVAISGVGLVSSLGHCYETVIERLRHGESGIRAVPEWEPLGIKSRVAGLITGLDDKLRAARISKKLLPGMSDAARYCCLAALDAVEDAGLGESDLRSPRTGCIVGSGTSDSKSVYHAGTLLNTGKIRRIDPFAVLRGMASSASAAITNLLKIRGPSYSISAACATSSHNIGHAYQLVRNGDLDVVIAGGGEEVDELVTSSFEGLRIALSTRYNDAPETASRPFDADRDGFVISGGGGIVIVENLERVRRRGGRVRAELIGYGANSDAYDLFLPEPEGSQAAACLEAAIADAGIGPADVDYVNCHGTSTVAGDVAEAEALRKVFGDRVPPFSSTKSMSGHALGAAGALETIFCVGMIERGFLAPSINVYRLDPKMEGLPVVTETRPGGPHTVLNNSFGFGGTNAALLLRGAEA